MLKDAEVSDSHALLHSQLLADGQMLIRDNGLFEPYVILLYLVTEIYCLLCVPRKPVASAVHGIYKSELNLSFQMPLLSGLLCMSAMCLPSAPVLYMQPPVYNNFAAPKINCAPSNDLKSHALF
ncbi:hypothetical protein F4803DRAFT_400029 [Xylaria telfairii]|nr:hypothetical protein F4803DRAFT_400029 [Xylaria telfairii]